LWYAALQGALLVARTGTSDTLREVATVLRELTLNTKQVVRFFARNYLSVGNSSDGRSGGGTPENLTGKSINQSKS
jgi:hypothetical protein